MLQFKSLNKQIVRAGFLDFIKSPASFKIDLFFS